MFSSEASLNIPGSSQWAGPKVALRNKQKESNKRSTSSLIFRFVQGPGQRLECTGPTSSQHGSENYPTGPDVCRLSFVILWAEELWSNIRKSPT